MEATWKGRLGAKQIEELKAYEKEGNLYCKFRVSRPAGFDTVFGRFYSRYRQVQRI